MKTFAITLLTFTASLFAQGAKVVALSADDTAAVNQAFDAVKAAQDRLGAIKQQIHDKYLTVEAELEESSVTYLSISGDATWTTSSWCEDPKDHTVKMVHEPERPKAVTPKPLPPKMVKYKKEIDGWGTGFEFSEGYKFIVPTPPKITPYTPNLLNYPNGIIIPSTTGAAILN